MDTTRCCGKLVQRTGWFVCVGLLSSRLAMAADGHCGAAIADTFEKVVCGSPVLSGLDREADRLYNVAASPRAGADTAGIRKQQSEWLTRRRACVGTHDPEACLRDSYLGRIAEIRAASATARSDAREGVSLGPFAFQCNKAVGIVHVTYVKIAPPLAWIARSDRAYTLEQTRSGSGARYEGSGVLFWEHQGKAIWAEPANGPEVTCTRIPEK